MTRDLHEHVALGLAGPAIFAAAQQGQPDHLVAVCDQPDSQVAEYEEYDLDQFA